MRQQPIDILVPPHPRPSGGGDGWKLGFEGNPIGKPTLPRGDAAAEDRPARMKPRELGENGEAGRWRFCLTEFSTRALVGCALVGSAILWLSIVAVL